MNLLLAFHHLPKQLLFFLLMLVLTGTGCKSSGEQGVSPIDDFLNTGRYGQSALGFSPQSFTYAPARVRSEGSTESFRVTNISTQRVILQGISIQTPHFAVDRESCTEGLDLAPASSCQIRVQFTPQSNGKLLDLVRLEYRMNSNNSSTYSELSVSGIGVSELNFSGLVSISNIGNSSLQLNWTKSVDASSFLLYRILDNGNPSVIRSESNSDGNKTFAVVSNLTPNTSYSFMVKGIDLLGNQDTNVVVKTATTLPNNLPQISINAPETLFSGFGDFSFDTNDALSGTDTDQDGDQLFYECYFDQTVDGSVAQDSPCSSLPSESSTPSFNSSSGVLSSWTPRYSDEGESFEIRVTATDSFFAKDSAVHTVNVNRGNYRVHLSSSETVDSSNPTRLNPVAPTALSWNVVERDAGWFDYSSENPQRIRVSRTGRYLVFFSLPLSITGQRVTVKAQMRVNGTPSSYLLGENSYARGADNHNETSLHFAGVTELAQDDQIEITVQQTASLSSGVATGDARLYVEYIPSNRSSYVGQSSQQVASSNFNSASWGKLLWSDSLTQENIQVSSFGGFTDIEINSAGNYISFFNIPLESLNDRVNVEFRIDMNSAPVSGAVSLGNYVRSDSSHDNSSSHWFGGLLGIDSGDQLSIQSQRAAASGTSRVYGSTQASLSLLKMPTPLGLGSWTATRLVSGNDWNPTTQSAVQWGPSEIMDSSVYSHSASTNGHQITLLENGEYLLTYSNALSGNVQRANIKSDVFLGGAAINYASCRTNYIRSASGHNSSSCSMAVPVVVESAPEILELRVQREARNGTLNDIAPATLTILKLRD